MLGVWGWETLHAGKLGNGGTASILGIVSWELTEKVGKVGVGTGNKTWGAESSLSLESG